MNMWQECGEESVESSKLYLPRIFTPLWLLISKINLGEQARAIVVVDIMDFSLDQYHFTWFSYFFHFAHRSIFFLIFFLSLFQISLFIHFIKMSVVLKFPARILVSHRSSKITHREKLRFFVFTGQKWKKNLCQTGWSMFIFVTNRKVW